jgi:hypothetical protein
MIEFNKDHFTPGELIEYLLTLDPEQELTLAGDIFQEGYLTEYIPPKPPSGSAPKGTLARIAQDIYGPALAKQLAVEMPLLKRFVQADPEVESDGFITIPIHTRKNTGIENGG